MTRVLVVEDEESYREALAYMLRKEGFDVLEAADGTAGLAEYDRAGADIVLLDLMMPGMPGTEVCRQLRQRGPVPVIMVTARDSEIDKVVGLELGADDYVTKPFSQRELVARIRAVLRRGQDVELLPDIVEAGGVRMDVERHEVSVNGERIRLALKEFELLEMLLRNTGRVMTRGQLIDRIWGADYVGDTKTLDVHVKRLRTKIEPDPANPKYLVTVRGLGYKFEGVVDGAGLIRIRCCARSQRTTPRACEGPERAEESAGAGRRTIEATRFSVAEEDDGPRLAADSATSGRHSDR